MFLMGIDVNLMVIYIFFFEKCLIDQIILKWDSYFFIVLGYCQIYCQ